MKCRYNLSMLLAVVLIIATGCIRWENDLPILRNIHAEMGRCNFDYNKVIKKNPKDFAANLCRGKAYYREGQYDQAISDGGGPHCMDNLSIELSSEPAD